MGILAIFGLWIYTRKRKRKAPQKIADTRAAALYTEPTVTEYKKELPGESNMRQELSVKLAEENHGQEMQGEPKVRHTSV